MGNAFAAQADDPSAIYFNPAGIVQLEGTQVSGGTNIVAAGNLSFKSDGNNPGTYPGETTDAEEETVVIPFGYITQQYSERLSFGLGVFSHFGLCTDWPDDWEGRFVYGGTRAELNTWSINPVVAFKPHTRMSFAFGVVLQYFDFELKNKTLNPATLNELDTKAEGDDWGWGFNLGLLVWVTDSLRFGASYRSEISHSSSDGKLTFSPQEAMLIPGFGFYNTGFEWDNQTPATATFGLAWTYGPLTVEFDAQWMEWSSYDEMASTLDTPVAGESEIAVPKKWRDVWQYSFGIQYALKEYLDLRAGFAYDEGPIPDRTLEPTVPNGDRQFYCAGLGVHFGGLIIDAAYSYMQGEDRTWNNSVGDPPPGGDSLGLQRVTGKFEDIDLHIVVVTASYKF
jgi:long-chain fatty acid transport protein